MYIAALLFVLLRNTVKEQNIQANKKPLSIQILMAKDLISALNFSRANHSTILLWQSGLKMKLGNYIQTLYVPIICCYRGFQIWEERK